MTTNRAHHPHGGKPDIRISKQYWALLQYSRWIRNGSTIIANDDPNTLIATSPTAADGGSSLIIVTTNFDDRPKIFLYDLGPVAAPSAGVGVDVYRTSGSEDCGHVGKFHVSHERGGLLLPFELVPLSITTFIVHLQQPALVHSALGEEWAVV